MNRLYLVRHAESVVNVTKEFSCRHVDRPLTDKGIAQAHQTAAHLATLDLHELYCSPMLRARQTAEIIGERLGLEPIAVENLREVQVGDLELQPATAEAWAYHNGVMRDWLLGQPERRFPGGEDWFGLRDRMRAAVEQILAGKDGRNVALVGHGGIFTLTLQDLAGPVDLAMLVTRPTQNCSITELGMRWDDGRLVGELVDWASCAHLSGWAADVISAVPDEQRR